MATNPTKTSYIQKARQLATQLASTLTSAKAYDDDVNKLGFVSTGGDPITQEDLDAAMALYGQPAGSLTEAEWNAAVYAISKNGNDYRGGEDQALLRIAQ